MRAVDDAYIVNTAESRTFTSVHLAVLVYGGNESRLNATFKQKSDQTRNHRAQFGKRYPSPRTDG
ncbi:hypothetical protein Poly51_63540 [Rubripirellula tenax]|uniref:Uncharacterized protein n=1 Tax=Rubripirellula tenax TaxID=2528015 RepID=A0A5C6E612_9BACT|nr:hypothetical protein Poly51_63540 [Rubripirellula tenax]